MDISITDGPNIVFFKSYPLHVYSQLVEYTTGMYGETKYAQALTIPRLGYQGNSFKIEITLHAMIANLKDTVFVLPDVVFEFYGKMDEALIDSASTKHAITIEQKKS